MSTLLSSLSLPSEYHDRHIMALSWKQPYGLMMFHEKIETRTWKTSYRGLVLICASKVSYTTGQTERISGMKQFTRITMVVMNVIEKMKADKIITDSFDIDNDVFHNGCAIGIGELVDCHRMREDEENATMVQYNSDLWCHVYKNVKPIVPFPYRGAQGFNHPTPEQMRKIKIL